MYLENEKKEKTRFYSLERDPTLIDDLNFLQPIELCERKIAGRSSDSFQRPHTNRSS